MTSDEPNVSAAGVVAPSGARRIHDPRRHSNLEEMPLSTIRLLTGDALTVLRTLPDKSAQTCVTSPPYWGLRNYGVDGQIGLEDTPEAYVQYLVALFREVRRVLRDDGTVWLNLGDSYAGSNQGRGTTNLSEKQASNAGTKWMVGKDVVRMPDGLKAKDLVGIPWRVAFALQADGWVLRQDVIWNKPNPMPESVRDRCTRSHEYIFMFSKAKWIGAPRRSLADISDDDARWLALFVDTEGNITVKRSTQASGKTTYGIQVSFANTHRGLLDRARTIIGRGTILERPGKNAPMFYLQISNIQAADLLARLYPHLIVKQRQARLGMFLQTILADSEEERHTKMGQRRGRGRSDAYTAKLELLWAANKALNHFGNPDISWIPAPSFGRWDSQPYYYDADAIKEPAIYFDDDRKGRAKIGHKSTPTGERNGIRAIYKDARSYDGKHSDKQRGHGRRHAGFNARWDAMTKKDQCSAMRNKRDVWTVATHPYLGAHFATFPPALIEPCVLAGCPPGGTVLDPFGGASTTGLVAAKHGRSAILIELNPDYVAMAARRIEAEMGLLAEVRVG